MKVTVLASGSSGNCTLIETKDDKILIDLGINFKQLNNDLLELNISNLEITKIFLTHEHSDHISGLAVFLKNRKIDIYMTNGTKKGIENSNNRQLIDEISTALSDNRLHIFDHCSNNLYSKLNFINYSVNPLPTFHDAIEPVGYIVEEEGKKIVLITDTGYVHKGILPLITGADCFIMECNHDPYILMESNRPYYLKMRILSDHGHMSNEDAFYILSQVIQQKTKYVFYAHISEECNLSEIIDMTRKKVFSDIGIDTSNIEFIFTSRIPTKRYEI